MKKQFLCLAVVSLFTMANYGRGGDCKGTASQYDLDCRVDSVTCVNCEQNISEYCQQCGHPSSLCTECGENMRSYRNSIALVGEHPGYGVHGDMCVNCSYSR